MTIPGIKELSREKSPIKHQAVIVFTICRDGTFEVRSLHEDGGDGCRLFTDRCVELVRNLVRDDVEGGR